MWIEIDHVRKVSYVAATRSWWVEHKNPSGVYGYRSCTPYVARAILEALTAGEASPTDGKIWVP